jgi:protein-S-isoprenylcysteine O-methyltransferase Ste14
VSHDRLTRDAAVGSALVAAQFALVGVCAAAGAPAFVAGRAGAGAWLLLAVGVQVGAWALAYNRPGNFNIRPVPRDGGVLIEHGPYRWIRHPMYTAVIAGGAACAWAAGVWWASLAAAALAVVLLAKALIEERAMRLRHPQYAAYCARTRRFVPMLL